MNIVRFQKPTSKLANFFILLCLLALNAVQIPPTVVQAESSNEVPAQTANIANFSLVWSDEFNGSSVNLNNWTCEVGNDENGWGNNELEYYTNCPNATVSGGTLILTAKKGSNGHTCWYGTCQYTSARLNTKGKQKFSFGKIEARIKVPIGQGLWPAFWMLGNNYPATHWPQSGEIDVMEHINNENLIHATAHWDQGGHVSSGCSSPNLDLTQFHVYDIEWDKDTIKWYVDGSQYCSLNIQNGAGGTEEFQKPFFILLNLAVGGSWPGSPNGSTVFPASMYVDYVRAYTSGTTGTSTSESQGTYDGWIRESSETSTTGGAQNQTATLLYVGDNAQDKQYRSFLSFDTSGLPDNAVITKAQLKLKVQGFVGGNMFTPTKTLGNLIIDTSKPYFGTSTDLVADDFQAGANINSIGTLGSIPSPGWRTITLKNTAAYGYINLTGTTQFRLRFTKDDNDDLGADYLKVYSGDAGAANRPQLIITYSTP